MYTKIYAPYRKFRYGNFYFPLGYRLCTDEELKILKKVPLNTGELKCTDGSILNQPKKKEARDVRKSKTKPRKSKTANR